MFYCRRGISCSYNSFCCHIDADFNGRFLTGYCCVKTNSIAKSLRPDWGLFVSSFEFLLHLFLIITPIKCIFFTEIPPRPHRDFQIVYRYTSADQYMRRHWIRSLWSVNCDAFLHDWPWISPWIKSMSNELDHYSRDGITIVWSLCHHQQSIVTSSAEPRPSKWDIGTMCKDRHLLSRVRIFSRWTVSALTRGLFWCLFPLLLCNLGNKLKYIHHSLCDIMKKLDGTCMV